ncbi:MAG TPA: hypothetical protein VIO94_02345 [Phenylobacterium sp.]
MKSIRSARLCWAAALAACLTATAPLAWAQTFPVQMAKHQSSYFKGVDPIVLPTYHLTFIVSQQATAVAGIGARARMTKVLSGVDEATLRKLTDEAHADLRAQFTAAGYTVVSDDAARAMVAANAIPLQPGNVDVVGGEGGVTVGKSIKQGWVMFGPTAAPALAPYKTGSNYLSQIPINNRFAKGQPMNTLVVLPSLVLDFANMEAGASSRFGRDTASAGGQAAFTIRGVQSAVTVIKVMDRDRMFPASIRPEHDYGVATAFATEQAGGASVAPLMIAGNSVARGDAVVVNLPVWQDLVRKAFHDYNAAIVASVVKGRG